MLFFIAFVIMISVYEMMNAHREHCSFCNPKLLQSAGASVSTDHPSETPAKPSPNWKCRACFLLAAAFLVGLFWR